MVASLGVSRAYRDEQLKRVSPEMQRIKRPPVNDALGLALYEQRIAQLLFDAIKAAGRPKG